MLNWPHKNHSGRIESQFMFFFEKVFVFLDNLQAINDQMKNRCVIPQKRYANSIYWTMECEFFIDSNGYVQNESNLIFYFATTKNHYRICANRFPFGQFQLFSKVWIDFRKLKKVFENKSLSPFSKHEKRGNVWSFCEEISRLCNMIWHHWNRFESWSV